MLKKTLPYFLILLAFILLIGILFVVNARLTSQLAGGDALRVPWMGARAFLFEGENPYTAEFAQEVQVALAEQPASEAEAPRRLDIPFYLLVFYFPFAYIENFDLARALWMSFAELALFGIGWLSITLSAWKASRLNLLLFFCALFFGFYGLYPLLEGSGAIFTALILFVAWLAFREGWDEILGFLLLLGTIHLQQGGILLFFLLFLLLNQRRWRVFSIFGMSLIAVIGLSLFLLSDWLIPFAAALRNNARIEQGFLWRETLQTLFPERGVLAAQILRVLAAIVLFFEWRAARGTEAHHLLWFASLSLSITPFLGIPLTPALFPFLFLPLALIFHLAQDRWRRARWIISLILFAFPVLWLVPLRAPESLDLLFFAFPFFLTLALYWLRWWHFRPPRTWADRIQ